VRDNKTPEEGGWLEFEGSIEQLLHYSYIHKHKMTRKEANLKILESRRKEAERIANLKPIDWDERERQIKKEYEEYVAEREARPYKYGPFTCRNPECGEEFMAQHHAVRYCCDHCRDWYNRAWLKRREENDALNAAMREAKGFVNGEVWEDLTDKERFWALKRGCPDHHNEVEFEFEGRMWTHYCEPGELSNSGKSVNWWYESFSTAGESYLSPDTIYYLERERQGGGNRRSRRGYSILTGVVDLTEE
jgi:hypothetical protein